MSGITETAIEIKMKWLFSEYGSEIAIRHYLKLLSGFNVWNL